MLFQHTLRCEGAIAPSHVDRHVVLLVDPVHTTLGHRRHEERCRVQPQAQRTRVDGLVLAGTC